MYMKGTHTVITHCADIINWTPSPGEQSFPFSSTSLVSFLEAGRASGGIVILREASRSISTRGSRFRVAVFWPWQSMQGKRGPSTPRGAPPTGIACPQALVERRQAPRHTGTGRHTVRRGQQGRSLPQPRRTRCFPHFQTQDSKTRRETLAQTLEHAR